MVNIEEFLKREEGWFGPDENTSYVYKDSLGYWTSGWGYREYFPLGLYRESSITVNGVTRIISACIKTREECQADLDGEIEHFTVRIEKQFPHIEGNPKSALIIMAYQLGMTGLNGFVNMIAELNKNEPDYKEVHAHALDSRWANQTPARAKRVAALFLEE